MGFEIVDEVCVFTNNSTRLKVHLHGATILSWTINDKENLFLSQKAILNGSKPIRGGIPLVFPIFGADPNKKLPQHGFARQSKWRLGDSTLNSVSFHLDQSDLLETFKLAWPHSFSLEYKITIAENSLSTQIRVNNTGSSLFSFNFLFHTYLRVESIKETCIKGLKGIHYAGMADFGDEEYLEMVCAEVGDVSKLIELSPKEEYSKSQTITTYKMHSVM